MRILVTLILVFSYSTFAQVGNRIDAVDWSSCGLTSDFNIEDVPEYHFDDFRSELDAGLNDNAVLQHIFREHRGGGIIFFDSGPYIFNKGIKLPSGFVLTGKHQKETQFIFDEMEKEADLILAQGKKTKEFHLLKTNVAKGDSVVEVYDAWMFKKGDWVMIVDKDEEKVTSSWAQGKSGQIVKVVGVEDDFLKLSSPLRRSYLEANKANVTRIKPVENAGVTDITIINNQETKSQTSNIQFRFAVNCFVAAVGSQNSNYAHVLLEYAANCAVQYSSFKNGHSYGDGGKAYGVVMQFATSQCLVLDNEFEHLRHSMLVQAGANGNLFSLNRSKDPYWKEPFLPKKAAGDLVLHGNYPYANLFADNTFQQLVIDNSHGKSGPDNFFINNQIESYGIIMSRRKATDSCVFVNNTISGTGLFKGKYRIKGKDHVEADNKVKGKIRPKVKN